MTNVIQLPDLSSPRARVAAGVRVQLAIANVSASKAARGIGISQPAMSRRINGELAFDIDELGRLATMLGVDLADFINPTPPKRPTPGHPSDYMGTVTRTSRLGGAGGPRNRDDRPGPLRRAA